MSSFQQFSFGENDSHIGGKTKPFKAEANRTYRVSFIWWKGLEDGKPDLNESAPRFIGAPTNFIQGAGYVVNKGPEFTKLAGGEAPRTRIASIIVVWPQDKNGGVDKTRLAAGEAEVYAWVISSDKYKSLEHINKEFPFGQHDFTMTCSDATYQKLTFTPCRDSLLRSLLENPKAASLSGALVTKAQTIASGIGDQVGREMTVAQVREKLAGGGGGGSSGFGGHAATTPTDTMVTGEIDNIVDDLLDN